MAFGVPRIHDPWNNVYRRVWKPVPAKEKDPENDLQPWIFRERMYKKVHAAKVTGLLQMDQ
jgi:hypothetical protein